jgi:hypothetical protein
MDLLFYYLFKFFAAKGNILINTSPCLNITNRETKITKTTNWFIPSVFTACIVMRAPSTLSKIANKGRNKVA